MALINCPECGKQVSSAASSCPNCGFPLTGVQPVVEAVPEPVKQGDLIFKPGFAHQSIEGVMVDRKNRTFKCGILGEIRSFDDIIDVDIFENGHSVTKTSNLSMIGRAAVGSMINPVGAIIGGVTAKKKNEEIIDKIEVQITVRSSLVPLIRIPIKIPKKMKKGSKDYEKAMTKAKAIEAGIRSLQVS